MNIYQLTQKQIHLISILESKEFSPEVISDTLESVENTDDLKEKRLAYISVIKAKRAMADARQSAANDITALIQRDCEDANRMEAALFASMQATGDKDLVGLEFEAHIKGKPVAVVIKDATLIPPAYMRVPEPTPPKAVPDKTAIKAALQKGEYVEGCTLGPDKKLVIL